MEQINDQLFRAEVVSASKEIYSKNLVQAGEGNISVRVPSRDELYITPTFNKYYNLRNKDVVHMKFNGTVLSEGKKPSSEYRLHIDVYMEKKLVNAVIHTHSPYATMLSVARKKIPILLEEQTIFLGGFVNISEFSPAHTENFSKNAIKALGTRNGCLMANHGVLVCGRTIQHAIKMAELVEKLAWIYFGASQIGGAKTIGESACEMFIKDYEKEFATHSESKTECEDVWSD